LPSGSGLHNYARYQITPDGISPMAFPGTPDAVVKVTSYEHDEHGITVEEPEKVKAMLDKRFAKAKSIAEEMKKRNSVKVYGDTNSENIIVFFGSTKCVVLESAKFFEKPAKLVQVVWLEPFDAEKVARELSGAKKIICVEGNRTAQLASLIREKTGVKVTDNILKYDSMPFDVGELTEEIHKILK
jgi:2-oxoglutarate ferredoxin oxidoreductase subunit alpha